MKDLNELYHWYETLSEKTLPQIDSYYAKDVMFKDPFNEISNREGIKKLYKDMFDKLDSPQFIFVDKIESTNQIFLTWDFKFKLKSNSYTIHGSSHLKLNAEGSVHYHRDYWDVGEELLLKLPVIKHFYKRLRKKLAST